jgi:CheY-like chemotaxis protein
MSALRKILVVDDDPIVGKSFNRVLSQDKGYVVITAQNAAEALDKMREQAYDLVFTDIKMPGMDGVELAERVRANQPWTPVVIVTGYGTTANEQRAKAAGVSAFLNKPLSPEMIVESAAHALRQPALTVVEQPETQAVEIVLPEPVAKRSLLKHMGLSLAAPFIGLAYALFFPVVGLAMLAWIGGKALVSKFPSMATVARLIRNVALFIAAPFVGLVYALMFPFVGLAMLAWIGGKALIEKTHDVK